MKNFYCMAICGSGDFNIEEWDETRKKLELTNLSEKEKQDILLPPMCKTQCFDCCAVVGATRKKNALL